jgi:hypothetical protein
VGADGVEHPLLVGELAGLELGVEQIAVGGQLEAAPAGGEQLQLRDLLLELGEQLARQTDGLRLVPSHRTIAQLQLHGKKASSDILRPGPARVGCRQLYWV